MSSLPFFRFDAALSGRIKNPSPLNCKRRRMLNPTRYHSCSHMVVRTHQIRADFTVLYPPDVTVGPRLCLLCRLLHFGKLLGGEFQTMPPPPCITRRLSEGWPLPVLFLVVAFTILVVIILVRPAFVKRFAQINFPRFSDYFSPRSSAKSPPAGRPLPG